MTIKALSGEPARNRGHHGHPEWIEKHVADIMEKYPPFGKDQPGVPALLIPKGANDIEDADMEDAING